MIVDVTHETDKVAQIRESFDSVFAQEMRLSRDTTVDLLAIQIGHNHYAIRLSELAGLYVGKPITWLPDSPSELLGVASFGDRIAAIYNLESLIGEPEKSQCRWQVLAACDPSIGFGFEELENYIRADSEAIVPRQDASIESNKNAELSTSSTEENASHRVDFAGGYPTKEALKLEERLRPIIEITVLVDSIRAASQAREPITRKS
ncbi:MAG: chemotaxis protein CheW [Nitrososphaerota archaeon]|nr:chemotaxis protein CheW [Nitrososphaerota archaeon]